MLRARGREKQHTQIYAYNAYLNLRQRFCQVISLGENDEEWKNLHLNNQLDISFRATGLRESPITGTLGISAMKTVGSV